MSTSPRALTWRMSGMSPPCTMPNSMYPSGAVSNARLLRSAQRSESRIARSMSSRDAGKRTHSSICMAMSAPSSRCTSIERSGDNSTFMPSMCERNVTARSLTLRRSDSDITWKPPESVSIGPFQPVKVCRPPSAAMRSAPGRSIR